MATAASCGPRKGNVKIGEHEGLTKPVKPRQLLQSVVRDIRLYFGVVLKGATLHDEPLKPESMFWIKLIAGLAATALISLMTNAVFREWPKSGKWAITSGSAACPVCGAYPNPIRIPRDRHEIMWGGNTCGQCGTKFDKHGIERKS